MNRFAGGGTDSEFEVVPAADASTLVGDDDRARVVMMMGDRTLEIIKKVLGEIRKRELRQISAGEMGRREQIYINTIKTGRQK